MWRALMEGRSTCGVHDLGSELLFIRACKAKVYHSCTNKDTMKAGWATDGEERKGLYSLHWMPIQRSLAFPRPRKKSLPLDLYRCRPWNSTGVDWNLSRGHTQNLTVDHIGSWGAEYFIPSSFWVFSMANQWNEFVFQQESVKWICFFNKNQWNEIVNVW